MNNLVLQISSFFSGSSDSDTAQRCQSPLQIVNFSRGFGWCRHVPCRSCSSTAETTIYSETKATCTVLSDENKSFAYRACLLSTFLLVAPMRPLGAEESYIFTKALETIKSELRLTQYLHTDNCHVLKEYLRSHIDANLVKDLYTRHSQASIPWMKFS